MAKKFQFRLEAVRKVREQERDKQRRVVAAQVRRVTDCRRRIRDLSDQARQAMQDLAAMQRTGVLDTTMICRQQAHRETVKRTMAQEEKGLAQELQELYAKQQVLAEANKQLKVIEKLRDKQMKQHLEKESREEQAQSDEASLQTFLRRQITIPSEVSA